VRSGACAAVFAGDGGHISEVLYIDVNASGTKMASAGMDSTIRVWDLESATVRAALENAHSSGSDFKPVMEQLPLMMSNLNNIWTPNYIDCIRWAGEMLLAKSIHNKVVLMEKITGTRRECMRRRHDFSVTNCNIWYLRFAVDPTQQWLALGNMSGVTCVWSVDDAVHRVPMLKLQHPKVNSTIRHCAFALDNKYLLTCTDDSRVIIWNIERKSNLKEREVKSEPPLLDQE